MAVPSQFAILCVGHHPQLMAIRETVLRVAGYRVIEAYTVDDALQVFKSFDVDIVVICHSIPTKTRQRLVLAMKEARPLTPVIALHEAYDLVTEADQSVDQLSGPEELLEAIASLLKKPVGNIAAHDHARRAKPGI